MGVLYRRRIEVEVAGLTISEPRISFEIERQIDNTQAKGTVSIYNLRRENEQQIYDRRGEISIQAGYPDTFAILFEGFVQRVARAREQLAHITRIEVGDTVRRQATIGGDFMASYDGPVTIRQIVQAISRAIGVPVGPLDAIPPPATISEFYWHGTASDALDFALRRVECRWFVSDGVIRINRAGEAQSDAPTIQVSARNGMIGTPIETDEGAEIRMFLNPLVVLGCTLEIESDTVEGRWKVVGLRNTGDNWQGSFETFADLREM